MSKRLLCVIAHPDDECFAFGGALVLAAQQGAEVYVLCLTDGQAASNRGTAASGEDLGRMRREEFAASCAVLGVARHELMEYQDGKLEFEAISPVAELLVKAMREFKPHVVLTFGMDGSLNTHPDHTSVSAFTTAAFQWCARTKRFPAQLTDGEQPWVPQKLYHQSTNFTMAGREQLSPAPWTLKLDVHPVQDLKLEAFQKHTSQLPVLDSVKPYWDEIGGWEFYTLAHATTPREAKQESGMFDGVVI